MIYINHMNYKSHISYISHMSYLFSYFINYLKIALNYLSYFKDNIFNIFFRKYNYLFKKEIEYFFYNI